MPDGRNSASSLPVSLRGEALELVDRRIVAARGVAQPRGGDRRHHLGVGRVTVSLLKSSVVHFGICPLTVILLTFQLTFSSMSSMIFSEHVHGFAVRGTMDTETEMMRTDVYDQLKERLFTGELRTGQFVSQRELASLLGATINPVREAIRKLEAEGLDQRLCAEGASRSSKAVQRRSTTPMTTGCCWRGMRFSTLRKPQAKGQSMTWSPRSRRARVCSKRIRPNVAVRLKVLDQDYQFHKELVDFQDNAIISKHYSLNAARLRLFRINTGQPLQRLDSAAEEHLEILQACRRRDGQTAETLLERHIEISREHALGIRPMRPLGEAS